jgi:hypothetical protein
MGYEAVKHPSEPKAQPLESLFDFASGSKTELVQGIFDRPRSVVIEP